MGRLLDRIKQQLHNLARRAHAQEPEPAAAAPGKTEGARAPGLRSELDPAGPSELERQLLLRQQRTAPPGPERQRRAQLSKPKRAGLVPGHSVLWGGPAATAAGTLGQDEWPNTTPSALLQGARLAGGDASGDPGRPMPIPSRPWLEGASLLSGQAPELPEGTSLFGPAPNFGDPADPPPRLF
ncbi:hypothetical protein CDN99_15750 [Roseateles aquatilis]|uniref:Uncharacterized protein n=1 Tax=Roseateles aquatilis TaxID=431061 RepID=A0A246J8R0_9BURK|nr:hypothetical protein [Roseateles aquatilis]MBY0365374.1 hypothetical protein [Burkholderiaceae bacterium]OWQ88922.1 hypothetical protein CDN99_15750 [Roseateles aquatilis]